MPPDGNGDQIPLAPVHTLADVARTARVDHVDLTAVVGPRAVLEVAHLGVVGKVEDGDLADGTSHDETVPPDPAVGGEADREVVDGVRLADAAGRRSTVPGLLTEAMEVVITVSRL